MPRRTPITVLTTAAAVPLVALGLAACGGGDNAASPAPPRTASGKPATLGVETNGDLGKILDAGNGRTLYLFQKDAKDSSACTGECASAWPPLRAKGKPSVGSGASRTLVGTIPRSDGQAQVTYNGHPVYTYTGDHQDGDTNGQGLNAFGARWFALSPAGTQVSGTGSAGSGGGGGAY